MGQVEEVRERKGPGAQEKIFEAVLQQVCKHFGLQENVKVLECKGIRTTLEFVQSPDHPDFGRGMIKVERALQAALRRPVDLRLESESDKNKRAQRNVLK